MVLMSDSVYLLQAKCLGTGEAVAIKKVLQDKRFKNRELQIMQLLDHPNVVQLKNYFFSTTEKDEVYLNLVLEYVSDTVYRVARHYHRMNHHMPLIYVQLYTFQVDALFVHLFIFSIRILSAYIPILSHTIFYILHSADMSCSCLLAWCCWGVPSRYQATKFIGKQLTRMVSV